MLIFFLDPVGFGLHSVFGQSHLSCRVWLLPALCWSGRGCPRRPLTPRLPQICSSPQDLPRSAGWKPFCSVKPWGRSVGLAMKRETALRRKGFNTLIKGFTFIWAILNYRLPFFFFLKLHGPALQDPLVILLGLTAFPYVSFFQFGFYNEIIKHLMVC